MVKLSISCAAFLLAATAGAGTFTVTLANGGSFESRYQPKAASWDENVILVLNEFGNWIALDRAEVQSVISDLEARGYGRVLDTTTKEFGFAPNDAPDPDAAPAAPNVMDQLIGQYFVPGQTNQPVEPGEVRGMPVFSQQLAPVVPGGQSWPGYNRAPSSPSSPSSGQ